MLKDLHTHRQQAQVLLKRQERRLVAKIGRKLIIEEDIAILIMILKYFKLDAKEDGAMPVLRIYNFWRSLYLAGHIDRSAAYRRITAIRNWLSGLGLIDWQDHTYEPPKFHEKKAIRTEMEGIAGVGFEIVKEKGRCCRWSLSQHFVGWLNLSVIHPPSLITTGITPIRPEAIYRMKLIGTRDDRSDQWRLMDDDGCQEWQTRRAA